MPVSDYSSRIVLIGYFIQKGKAGSAAERAQWSQELYDRYDGDIIAACAGVAPPLDPSPEERSIMAVIAAHAVGNSGEQAQEAVAVYVTFRGV